jgi:hypothetical protein
MRMRTDILKKKCIHLVGESSCNNDCYYLFSNFSNEIRKLEKIRGRLLKQKEYHEITDCYMIFIRCEEQANLEFENAIPYLKELETEKWFKEFEAAAERLIEEADRKLIQDHIIDNMPNVFNGEYQKQ